MSFKFEFFHLNLFVSGPVFDYLSNESGLVRVFGCLGAVLCAGVGVGLLSSFRYRNLNFNDFSLTMDLSIIPSYRTSLCSMFDKHNAKNWAIIIDL